MRRAVLLGLLGLAVLFPASASGYYRDWMVDPLVAMNVQLADNTNIYDSADSEGIGCRRPHQHQRLAKCRYRLRWDDYESGPGACNLVVYVRPGRWRFTTRGSDCPRSLLTPRGYQH